MFFIYAYKILSMPQSTLVNICMALGGKMEVLLARI